MVLTLVLEEFKFSENCVDAISEPSDDDEERDMLLYQNLLVAHHDNPVLKRAEPFERYVEHCDSIKKSSMHGAAQLIYESPSLPKHLAVRLQVALIGYFARTCWCMYMRCLSEMCFYNDFKLSYRKGKQLEV